jgi:hypothetical protein
MKPGYKTTEFWIAAAASILGIVIASGVITPDSAWDRLVGMATMALSSMGYSVSRGVAKR